MDLFDAVKWYIAISPSAGDVMLIEGLLCLLIGYTIGRDSGPK